MSTGKESYTLSEEIKDTSMGKPHVVILGAGASIAATPMGDRNGKKLPSMANFVEILNLQPIFNTFGISYQRGNNFETLYASIANDPDAKDAAQAIEKSVEDYFRSLCLPEEANVYDRLVLSLRSKDLIATFNWDPFLYMACYRNRHVANLPNVVYLHGNVATAYCLEHKKKSVPGAHCSVCQKPLTASKLLFPINKKDYVSDPYINAEWNALQSFLKSAYLITIFGYGAPSSDLEAVDLMKKAWGHTYDRALEQTEIIDIRDSDELADLWSPFIHSHHYDVCADFDESWLAKHPRRTCEAAWQQYMECQFLNQNPLPKTDDLEILQKWVHELVEHENE
ncbi:MAG: hypothetical protein EOM26_08950 [Alphaproteobacteria bacterium]|nr:hypothetical protein [Alphaproteobacteria bacterium]